LKDLIPKIPKPYLKKTLNPTGKGPNRSISSQKADIVVNTNTSVDVYFGPESPAGKESKMGSGLAIMHYFLIFCLNWAISWLHAK
jgi:hypothetical protein